MKATEKIGAESAGANKELKEFKELKELKGGAEGSGAEGAEAESPEPAAEANQAESPEPAAEANQAESPEPAAEAKEATQATQAKEATQATQATQAKEATQATQGEAEAYKRGRNDAIREFMQKDTAKTPALEARNLTPGVPSTLQPPEDLFLARLFRLRPSVWEYGRN